MFDGRLRRLGTKKENAFLFLMKKKKKEEDKRFADGENEGRSGSGTSES